MSVVIKDLQNTGGAVSRLDGIAREWLGVIDSKLREAERTFGRNVVCVELATSFDIPGLDISDQQRYIYTEIIRSLTKREFECSLLLGELATELYICFEVGFSDEELAAMNSVIRNSVLRSDTEVDLFARKGMAEVKKFRKEHSPEDGKSKKSESKN